MVESPRKHGEKGRTAECKGRDDRSSRCSRRRRWQDIENIRLQMIRSSWISVVCMCEP